MLLAFTHQTITSPAPFATELLTLPRLATDQWSPFVGTSIPMHSGYALLSSVLLVLLALSIITLVPRMPSPQSFFRSPPPRLINSRVPHPSDASDCIFSDGKWVRDAAAVTAYREDCPFLDPGFQCISNGRSNSSFRYWRWQPHGCQLPK
jgi:hypothetical protein